MKTPKPNCNGRLEVAWRIYDAICNIATGDLSKEQRQMIVVARDHAYKQWELEGQLVAHDGLQLPGGLLHIIQERTCKL